MSFRTRAFHPRRAVIVLASIAIFMCAPALADSLVVPEIQVSKRIDAVYRCPDGKSLKVAYFNGTNGQSFALVPWDGVPTLMVSTVSASGVRYQSGFLTWWSKGRNADLYDARINPDKPVLQGCSSQ